MLYALNGASEGGGAYGELLLGDSGNIFGTAKDGGTPNYGFGTAFRLSRNKDGTYSDNVLKHFDQTADYREPDGLNPRGGLISDAQGNLYGTTVYGGKTSDMGLVYELSPNGRGGYREKVLHAFSNEDGRYPWSSLTFDSAGNLYGTTYGVPDYCGTVFRLSPTKSGKWKETVLHDFGPSGGDGSDGCESASSVVFDSAGNLYGTTSGGGNNGYYGIVYELSPKGHGRWKETILHKFSLDEGNLPYAGVTLGPSGELYGTTFGGANQSCYPIGCGAVYDLRPSAHGKWSETLIYKFNGRDGENPYGRVTLDGQGNLYGTTWYGGNQSCNMGCGTVFKLVPNNGAWQQTILHYFNGSGGVGPVSDLVFDPSRKHLFGTTVSGGIQLNCCGTVFEITP